MLLLALVALAGLLRGWQLDSLPPGLYRDEAYNGLDALGIWAGRPAIFFPANNGREPGYIYLTALALRFFGQTVLGVRAAAAAVGTLTTWMTYRLTADWFNQRVALLAAALWAVTLWPVHLSRLGLRPILLPATLALALWLAGRAYRADAPGRARWLVAGIAYGATFYTYLAARFTPLFILILLLLMLWRRANRRLRHGLPWALVGAGVTIAPLLVQAWRTPALVIGRIGQVSVLNPAINGGDLAGTLGRQFGRAFGLFFFAGDSIGRHNVPGRPFLDIALAAAAIAGLIYCLRHWQALRVQALLLWTAVMLGPTILAEDSPHFLRAVGILPAALIFPALGLSQLWTWPKLPGWIRQTAVIAVIVGSLLLTVRDLRTYYVDPATAYWFDGAARQLADEINNDINSGSPSSVWLDATFWDAWPTVRFLVGDRQALRRYERAAGPQPVAGDIVYAWPYDGLATVTTSLASVAGPVRVTAVDGALNKGDRETTAYPLYIRFALTPAAAPGAPLADFVGPVQLNAATIATPTPDRLLVTLEWSTDDNVDADLKVFVHVVTTAGTVAQSDRRPADENWPTPLWRPGQIVVDIHQIDLPVEFDPLQHTVVIGLYDATTAQRLSLVDEQGAPGGDSWPLTP